MLDEVRGVPRLDVAVPGLDPTFGSVEADGAMALVLFPRSQWSTAVLTEEALVGTFGDRWVELTAMLRAFYELPVEAMSGSAAARTAVTESGSVGRVLAAHRRLREVADVNQCSRFVDAANRATWFASVHRARHQGSRAQRECRAAGMVAFEAALAMNVAHLDVVSQEEVDLLTRGWSNLLAADTEASSSQA